MQMQKQHHPNSEVEKALALIKGSIGDIKWIPVKQAYLQVTI